MLRTVLEYHQPREWQHASYSDRPYQLFNVSAGSDEYNQVTSPFLDSQPALVMRSLRRVQNPFQLGRLIVRSEQRRHRGEHVTRETYYHPLDGRDLQQALEYNMDVRRYQNRCESGHYLAKDPVFLSTPGEAFSGVSQCSEKVILVCQVLELNGRSQRTHKSVDTEYMPNYVALIEN